MPYKAVFASIYAFVQAACETLLLKMLTVARAAACMLCCAAETYVLMAEWAGTNPVALYGLPELACRRPSANGLKLAAIWFKAPNAWPLIRQQPQQQQQQAEQQQLQPPQQQQGHRRQALLKTWPEYKAYVSAVASWCKALVKVFPDALEAALQGDHGHISDLGDALGLMLQDNEADGGGCLGLGQAPGHCSPTLQAVRLLLLLWLTRVTLGFMKWCLPSAAAQHSNSNGSNSRDGSSSSSGGGSSSSSEQCGYGGTCDPAGTSNRSSSSGTPMALEQKTMLSVAVFVLHALVKWQRTTSELTRTGSTAAAAASADVSCLTTRKRLSRLPLQGLPEAVTTQLDRCSNIWRRLLLSSATGDADELTELPALQIMLEGLVGDGMEGLQDLRREMVVLFELLLEEVPSPLGCNFPGCSNLSGFTEAEEADIVCTRCQEARYCSRQCQVDHWEQHKRACRRLRKQAEAAAAAAAAGGRPLQAEMGGRTSGGGVEKVAKASRKGVAKG